MWRVGNTLKKPLKLILFFCFLSSAFAADYQSKIDAFSSGTIEGLVKFPGEAPPSIMFGNRADPACPAGIPQGNLFVEPRHRGIKNALVILSIKEGKPMVLGAKADLVLSQCFFAPRVMALPVGTSLTFKNQDNTRHSIHAWIDDVTVFAVDVPAQSKSVHRPLEQESAFYQVTCDRHLWETSWIYVTANPYVTVTDDKGEFKLTQVPPGHYQIRAWHEGWGTPKKDKNGHPLRQPEEETLDVSVHTNHTTEVTFEGLAPTFHE